MLNCLPLKVNSERVTCDLTLYIYLSLGIAIREKYHAKIEVSELSYGIIKSHLSTSTRMRSIGYVQHNKPHIGDRMESGEEDSVTLTARVRKVV